MTEISAAESNLTAHEQEVLREMGLLKGDPISHPAPSETAQTHLAELIDTSLTVDQAAEQLGFDRAAVLSAVEGEELFALRKDDEWVLPAFQFAANGKVPQGFARVLQALDPGTNPLGVYGFFTHADPDLDGLTVIEWLDKGRDPAVPADLAAWPYGW